MGRSTPSASADPRPATPTTPPLRRPRDLWSISVPAYGPSVLSAIGTGAVMPVVALSARDLGASVGVAALAVATIGIGALVGALPAGALVARIGERRALMLSGLAQAVVMVLAFFAQSVAWLFAAILLLGMVDAVFQLARQAYLTDAVPLGLRARALSTLGGVHRIGIFIGPLLGAALIAATDLRVVYLVGAAGGIAAAVLVWFARDITAAALTGGHGLGGRPSPAARGQKPERVLAVMRAHLRVLATLGTGALVVSAARAARASLLPLWGEHIGLDAAQTSLVFGIAAGVDMLLFYPAGAIMDRYGRVWTAVPAVIIMGSGMAAILLTDTMATFAVVAIVIAIGNGLGSGIVMTLGSDASPPQARPQFLAAWRLVTTSGILGGPLLISGVTAIGTLAAAAATMGAVTLAGAVWLAIWVPRNDPRRQQISPAEESPSAGILER